MENDLQNICIRIKTLDNSLVDLKVPKDITVSELKAKIEKVLYFKNSSFLSFFSGNESAS